MRCLKPILIAGPTASGKSALAVALARHLNGVVINADSMQVYAELAVLTARPGAADLEAAPHRLYGHVPAAEAYSAGRFMREAAIELETAAENGLRPIIVGGTGLYFKALLEGLSPVPPVPDEVRQFWRGQVDRFGAPGLHALLANRDPDTASRLRPTDPQRVVRALEVLDATGRPLADWQRQPGTPVLQPEETVRLVVQLDRSDVMARADARFDRMIEAGALNEAAALGALALDPGLPAMRALGVRPLLAHIRGEMTLDAAVAEGKAETRRYIKRQGTWLASNMNTWKTLSEQEMESIGDIIVSFIDF